MKDPQQQRITIESFLDQKDIWFNSIIPFLGEAEYARVAPACLNLKAYFEEKYPLLLLWVRHIFPFLGMGHYAFVAGTSSVMKKLYKAYCDSVPNPPPVWRDHRGAATRSATTTDTFRSAALGSVPCAEYWYNDDYNKKVASHGRSAVQTSVCMYLAQTGNLPVLRWAREVKSFRWNSWTTTFAAECGHWSVLEYAREQHCPWDARVCANAARRGDLAMLRFARERGCPWDQWTFTWAMKNGDRDVLQYVLINCCPRSVGKRRKLELLMQNTKLE